MKALPRKLLAGSCLAAVAALLAVAPPASAATGSSFAPAPAAAGPPETTELEVTLYVQAPDFAGGGGSIVLVWLPEPLQNTCLGRMMKECFNIDYCIRTTNPNGPQCRNLAVPRARFPHYPADMRPHRAISVVLRALGNANGFDRLKSFYKSVPKDSLERLSSDATIRARIRYNNNPSFESFTLLEVLSVP
jgi:hypothetical protein